MVAKGSRITDSTSLKAKAVAIRECLAYCKENDIQHIIIESDSSTVVQIIQGIWEVPWSVALEINSIRALMNVMLVRVVYSFREGNTPADFSPTWS